MNGEAKVHGGIGKIRQKEDKKFYSTRTIMLMWSCLCDFEA